MFPVTDSPRARRTPFVNVAIIIACIAVFVYELTLSGLDVESFFLDHGAVPLRMKGWLEDPSGVAVPLTVLTAAFIHAGWLHLAGNMVFLWVFGDNIEDALGHALYALFYAVCAVGAAALQYATDTTDVSPMVGASGAIAGVMGAYLVLYPTARIGVFVPVLFFFGAIPVPAFLLIGAWFALQLLNGVATLGNDTLAQGGVAFWAHVGGFATGAAIVLLARPLIRVGPARPRRGGTQVR